MLLTIDIGNTNVVCALYDGNHQLASWRMDSDDACNEADCAQIMAQEIETSIGGAAVEGVIIASVVPLLTPVLVAVAHRVTGCAAIVVGDAGVDLGISINIDQPEQAGADRLVNAVGAHAGHSLPAIILDFGTATTLDLIGANGAYEGGIIAPGVNLSVEALERAAAQLPHLDVRPWSADLPILGKNTISAMESGVFWGYVSMIDGLLSRLRREYGKSLPAIATGGLASLFAGHVPGITMIDPDLTVKGLVEIYARNRRD